MQRQHLEAKVSGKNFDISADRPARFDLTKLAPMLEDVHERLSSMVIECLSFEKFIPKYDKPTTLFYLDSHITAAKMTIAKACLNTLTLNCWPTFYVTSKADSFCR